MFNYPKCGFRVIPNPLKASCPRKECKRQKQQRWAAVAAANMLSGCSTPISCNFTTVPHRRRPSPCNSLHSTFSITQQRKQLTLTTQPTFPKVLKISHSPKLKQIPIGHICRSSTNEPNEQPPNPPAVSRDWTTSILLFVLWAGLMYYVFLLTPNQTPSRDMYFWEKLLNLKGDDGFEMNQVLVSLWYIMGLWPLAYSMLLLPSGRSSNSKVPVWPFLVLSCFGGAYALLPYFVLWKPPPPSIKDDELGKWPLNFVESKLTAGFLLFAGLGTITYAGLANADVWKEFYQYFRESKFIHATTIDFTLLSTFAPFWVYNDMTARRWLDKGSWILPLTLIPFLGPAFYLVLRPPFPAISEANKEDKI